MLLDSRVVGSGILVGRDLFVVPPLCADPRDPGTDHIFSKLCASQFRNHPNTAAPFDRFATPSDNLDPNEAFHTLLQQALVQSPHVYLTALAAMKTTNHQLISLPSIEPVLGSAWFQLCIAPAMVCFQEISRQRILILNAF